MWPKMWTRDGPGCGPGCGPTRLSAKCGPKCGPGMAQGVAQGVAQHDCVKTCSKMWPKMWTRDGPGCGPGMARPRDGPSWAINVDQGLAQGWPFLGHRKCAPKCGPRKRAPECVLGPHQQLHQTLRAIFQEGTQTGPKWVPHVSLPWATSLVPQSHSCHQSPWFSSYQARLESVWSGDPFLPRAIPEPMAMPIPI